MDRSFKQKYKLPKNECLTTRAKGLPKASIENKKRIFSHESGRAPDSKITGMTQVDILEECGASASDDKNQLAKYPPAYVDSHPLPSSATRCGARVKEKNRDDRKLTRDVIFEAEQIIIKSKIENIEENDKPSFKMKAESDNERILREPLGEQMKEIKLQKRMSSSTPSLVNGVANSFVEEREMDFRISEDVNSRKSSILNVARKISRSTSRSLKSLNNLGRFVRINDKGHHISVEQQQKEGAYALLRAAKNDSLFQIQTLVSHGISTEVLDQRGWTPLTVALENENMKCAEALVQMNANANFVHENGMTILHHITLTGVYKGVKFLLRHGAYVNAEDSEGWPPLHYAIRQHYLKCTALLLAAGCDSQTYTQKRLKEYEEVVRLATIGKWKYHWQQELDIDMSNAIQL